jgi:hypothetical protein
MDNEAENFLPDPPVFADELVEQCRQDRDFRPILFEWYKYVGVLCSRAACLAPDSPAFRKIPPVHYAVLIGLLNRCSRLMVANVRLSCTGRYGETTRLLDRSIAETSIKVQWLCHKDDPDCFQRYLADGLKKDLQLRRHIEDNIRKRGGDTLVIETRMLRSIQECINLSGLSEEDIGDAKPLHDFAAMCRDLDLGDLFYTAIQRMGSHAIHGTWSDLIFNYLRLDHSHGFHPRDHEIETQDVQYIVVPRLVCGAIASFLDYVAADPSELRDLISVLEGIEERLVEIQGLAWTSDFGKE